MSMKKLLTIIAALALVGVAWLFYEYKQIAGEAEARVEKDIRWLMTKFEQGDYDQQLRLASKTHLETQLMIQGIDENNRFVRGYHSLFIENGEHSCLLSEVVYEFREPSLHDQRWLKTKEGCLP